MPSCYITHISLIFKTVLNLGQGWYSNNPGSLLFISKEVGSRPVKLTWNQFHLYHAPSYSLVQMLSLLALVSEEDKVMKESDKVIEVEKEKLARIEK